MSAAGNGLPPGRGTLELSAVVPVYGCRDCLYELYRRLCTVLEPLVSERYPLGEGEKAMERATAPGVLKVLLEA